MYHLFLYVGILFVWSSSVPMLLLIQFWVGRAHLDYWNKQSHAQKYQVLKQSLRQRRVNLFMTVITGDKVFREFEIKWEMKIFTKVWGRKDSPTKLGEVFQVFSLQWIIDLKSLKTIKSSFPPILWTVMSSVHLKLYRKHFHRSSYFFY